MQMRRWSVAVACGAAIGLALVPGAAPAQVREDPSQLPFYARSIAGSGEWSPIIFYRPVGCVPETFNLEAMFDVPRVFGCVPMTVDSFALWEEGPGLEPAPRHARSKGLGAVPIWFVRTDDLLSARSDGVVTLAELRSLEPLTGSASFYTETLHPAEGARTVLVILNATGTLDDGRAFSLHVTLNESNGLRLVRVTFEA
jgi:hypothetical protein